MLIKEYRIPMPMSVEEYRIAQLYMIQVRSRHHIHQAEGMKKTIREIIINTRDFFFKVRLVISEMIGHMFSDAGGVAEQRELVCW